MSRLSMENGALVLWDTYTATTQLEPGDAVYLSGPLQVGASGAPSDDVVGLAFQSAFPGQPVPVAIAGVHRTRVVETVVRGDSLTPSDLHPGRARRLNGVGPVMGPTARRHALVLEDAVAGRTPKVQLVRQ
jgi:hypothetical protein